MKIIVYRCLDDTDGLPDLVTGKGAERKVIGKGLFVARIRAPGVGVGGKTVEMWHPVIFEAPSAEAVRAAAQSWWDDEAAKHRPDGRKVKRKTMEAAPGTEAVEDEEAIG